MARRKVSVNLPRLIAVSLTPQIIKCLPPGAKATFDLAGMSTESTFCIIIMPL